MKKLVITGLVLSLALAGWSQSPTTPQSPKVSSKLVFQPGQQLDVTVELQTKISQEAMGNAIDFTSEGTALHRFKVTNATDNNTTLRHDVKKITFKFDGMGQKRTFDSDNKKDMEGFFGPYVKDIIGKSYDMIIDPAGKTIMVKPENFQMEKPDDRVAIVFNMLKDVTDVVFPPKKNEASFFKILPQQEMSVNEGWVESSEDINGKSTTTYAISAITDTTILVGFKGTSTSSTKSELMGMQTTTNLTNNFSGSIILDRASGHLREKTTITESNGTTEVMGGSMPVTSKTTVVTRVKPSE